MVQTRCNGANRWCKPFEVPVDVQDYESAVKMAKKRTFLESVPKNVVTEELEPVKKPRSVNKLLSVRKTVVKVHEEKTKKATRRTAAAITEEVIEDKSAKKARKIIGKNVVVEEQPEKEPAVEEGTVAEGSVTLNNGQDICPSSPNGKSNIHFSSRI